LSKCFEDGTFYIALIYPHYSMFSAKLANAVKRNWYFSDIELRNITCEA
jgi:hypothetical protein